MPRAEQYSTEDGFWEGIGLSSDSRALINQIHEGFDYRVFQAVLGQFGLSRQEVGRAIAIPQTTLKRRARDGRITTQESDRLYRFIEVMATAEAVFEGDIQNMLRWMRSPIIALGSRRPIDLMATSVESRHVLSVLGKIEYGDFS